MSAEGGRDFDAFSRVARDRRSLRAFLPEIHLTSFANVRATAGERQRVLPGDTLIPDAKTIVMHAITIAAPLERVWPWLVQMVAGRAGWYSDDWVDNGRRPSAVTILPELQHLAPGNVMPSLPGAEDSFVVAIVEAERDLIERVYALLANAPRWLMAPAARFGHGVMQARQLRGIKQRAEAAKPGEGVPTRSATTTQAGAA